jgi:RNA polymerase sigma-70 factor (ECF subfamily)
VDKSLSAWFAREILPCEAALTRYLRRVCPKREDIADLRQDIYVKAYEAAKTERPSQPRAFLFTVARNLVIDRIRRNRIVSIEPTSDLDVLNVLIDELTPERQLNAHQELKVLGWAFGLLPDKCREVVWLRKVDDVSQAEVAQLLGISVRTVEFHVQKGMRLLAQALFGDEITCEPDERDETKGIELEHGE